MSNSETIARVVYFHAPNLEELERKVTLETGGTKHSTNGRPFRAKIEDFPTFCANLSDRDRHVYHMRGMWVQAVTHYME